MSEITSAGKVTDDIEKEFRNNFVNFIVDQEIKSVEKLMSFKESLNTFGARSVKLDYELEDRVSLEDSTYNFTAVDIKNSIDEFVKMTDYKKKEMILEETYDLYELCNKEQD